ncbi:hypothetical protein SFUMM280S_06935 [Streptomyces fumanus]
MTVVRAELEYQLPAPSVQWPAVRKYWVPLLFCTLKPSEQRQLSA